MAIRVALGVALVSLTTACSPPVSVLDESASKSPDNGWSLSGLQVSLERQGRAAEAAAVKARLDEMWKLADTELAAGRAR